MKTSKTWLLVSLFPLLLIASCGGETDTGSATDTGPTVTLSMTRIPAKEWIDVEGTGFTPDTNVTSHLLQPDGREFPYLPILTDSNGEFTHEVDTLLLLVGTHELWVVDDTTGVSSNIAGFDVTREQATGQ
jgi:hypothetical protein